MTSWRLATLVDEDLWFSQFHGNDGILSLTGTYSPNCVPSGRQNEDKRREDLGLDLLGLPLLRPNLSLIFPKKTEGLKQAKFLHSYTVCCLIVAFRSW